jgi:hypothetical protein
MNLPNRASDAGPDLLPVPNSWRDLCDFAQDDIRYAERYNRDDLAAEKKLRIEHLEAAIEKLQLAVDLLKAGER